MTVGELYPLGILISTVAIMVIGFLWYGPVFGKQWAALVGRSMESMGKDGNSAYFVAVINALLISFITNVVIVLTDTTKVLDGLLLGFLLWLGFNCGVSAMHTAFSGRSWRLLLIDTGYTLSAILLASVIFTITR